MPALLGRFPDRPGRASMASAVLGSTEMAALLECSILANGFLRLRCGDFDACWDLDGVDFDVIDLEDFQ